MHAQTGSNILPHNVLSEFIHSWQQIRYFKFLKKKNTFKEANNQVKHYNACSMILKHKSAD